MILSMNENAAVLKAAIVGLGRIGSLLETDPLREKPCTHAGAIVLHGETRGGLVLAAGADTNPERRALFAETWKTRVYADAEEMLRETRPHILHIATHPDSHLFYCALAAQYGAAVAVCEKPLAASLKEARKIAALEKSGAIKIVVNHERRYSADYIEAGEILREEKLGPLLGARAVLYMGAAQKLRDVLWHDGTHLIDALLFLSGGKIRHKKHAGAKLSSRAGSAWLFGELKRAGGKQDQDVPFVIECGAGRDHLVFEIEFSCARGRLRIGNGIFEIWESVPAPYAENFRALAKTREGFSGPTGYFSGMVADAVLCAGEGARVPRSRAADGLAVIEYLHHAAGR